MDKKIKEILDKMSIDEKIGQLNQIAFKGRGDNIESIREEIKKGNVGAVVLANGPYAGSDKQADVDAELLDSLQKCAVENGETPILFGRDVIHGYRIAYPVPLAMAASFDFELIESACEYTAKSVRNDAIRWVFAPMIDISRDPRWGRCIESPGEDSYLCEMYAKAVVGGFAKEGVAVCAKHFVGYGASEGGRDYHRTEISEYSLRNFYLKPFKAAVEAGCRTIMSSFNDINGLPVTNNKYLMTDVLKNEWKFKGFVVSDWESVIQLMNQGVAENETECAALAFSAGLDMDMASSCYLKYIKNLISDGIIDEEQLDEAVMRILRVKYEMGLFDNPYSVKSGADISKEAEMSLRLAEESMVLLKNTDKTLPLKKGVKVAVIGDFVCEERSHAGNWALDIDTALINSVRDIFEKSDVDFIYPESMLPEDMIGCAAMADTAVVVIGESYLVTGETHSIANIEIPQYTTEFVKSVFKVQKNLVGIFCYARPRAIENIEIYFKSILYAWHAGTNAAEAICNIITGKVNPSGKLPMTMPRSTGQIPIYYNVTSSGRTVNGYYDKNAKNYEDCLGTPMYEFGYGLSYSEFIYSDIKINRNEITARALKNGETVKISVDLKNISNTDGYETVQCYVRDKVSSVMRPIRELKKHKRAWVKAKENMKIEFELAYGDLAYFANKGEAVLECGEYEIYVGGSCYAENTVCLTVTQ